MLGLYDVRVCVDMMPLPLTLYWLFAKNTFFPLNILVHKQNINGPQIIIGRFKLQSSIALRSFVTQLFGATATLSFLGLNASRVQGYASLWSL